jgi:hypothetical protein
MCTYRNKEEPRWMKKAVKGYLVGYDRDERYRVWIKGTRSIVLSRDVVFEENPIRCVKSYDSKSETSDSFSPKTFENTSDQLDYEDENHSEDSEEVQSENLKSSLLKRQNYLQETIPSRRLRLDIRSVE